MIDQFTWRRKLMYLFGSPGLIYSTLTGIPYFIRTWREYKRKNTNASFGISLTELFPILSDRHASAGVASGDYFHQDLWAARKVFACAPQRHIDVGSRLDGFIAHLLTFMPVTVIDFRKLESKVAGLTFICDDATELSQFPSDSVDSLSSLHAAEHFGLGRYSDPVDPGACFKFMNALQRVLAPGGRLYFSVPVGRERVAFNAHRIFAPKTIIESFPKLRLVSFCYVGDDGNISEVQEPIAAAAKSNYGCGLFEFTK
jgi:SAM-dependent methyltransferase